MHAAIQMGSIRSLPAPESTLESPVAEDAGVRFRRDALPQRLEGLLFTSIFAGYLLAAASFLASLG